MNKECRDFFEFVPNKEGDHFVVKMIKDKLTKSGGIALINLIIAGKEARIWFDKDGNGLESDKIAAKYLTWDVFIAAYNIAVVQDGELYKGYAREGKLGSKKLPINSLEGYIFHEVYGVAKGKTAIGTGYLVAAILAWVGIFINERGSTLKFVLENVCIKSYEEALENAKVFLAGFEQSVEITDNLNSFRHWYYFQEIDSFVPGKFIEYKQTDIKAYKEGFHTLDGHDTERIFQEYFLISDETDKKELVKKLEIFLDQYNKQPNKNCQIYIKR